MDLPLYAMAFAASVMPLLACLGLALSIPEMLRALPRTGEAAGR